MGNSVGGTGSIYRNCRLLCNHWVLSSATMSYGDVWVATVLHCESVLVLTSHSGRKKKIIYFSWKAPLDINPSITHSFIFPPSSRWIWTYITQTRCALWRSHRIITETAPGTSPLQGNVPRNSGTLEKSLDFLCTKHSLNLLLSSSSSF